MKKGVSAGRKQPWFPSKRKEYADIGSFAVGFQNRIRDLHSVAVKVLVIVHVTLLPPLHPPVGALQTNAFNTLGKVLQINTV